METQDRIFEDCDYALEDPMEEDPVDNWVGCSNCGWMGTDVIEHLHWNVAKSMLRFRCPACNDIQESKIYE